MTVWRARVDFSRDGINRFLGTLTVENDHYNCFTNKTVDYAKLLCYMCKNGARWKICWSKETP